MNQICFPGDQPRALCPCALVAMHGTQIGKSPARAWRSTTRPYLRVGPCVNAFAVSETCLSKPSTGCDRHEVSVTKSRRKQVGRGGGCGACWSEYRCDAVHITILAGASGSSMVGIMTAALVPSLGASRASCTLPLASTHRMWQARHGCSLVSHKWLFALPCITLHIGTPCVLLVMPRSLCCKPS